VIISIISALAMGMLANTESGLRVERAARETAAAIRFARLHAMTEGVSYTVRFNVAGKSISVIDPSTGSAKAAPVPGGSFQINLTGNSDVANVAMTPVISGDSTDPYDVVFSPAGGTRNGGTVTFSFGVNTQVLQIQNVGDPIIQGGTRQP